MKVKIGDKCHSSEEIPIMLILSDEEKALIRNMHPHSHKFCCYPIEMDPQEIRLWMNKA